MTIGVGGADATTELSKLQRLPRSAAPITSEERVRRIEKAQAIMRAADIAALYLDASTSLYYFSGLRLGRSERLHGAVLPASGEIQYVSPAFEEAKLRQLLTIGDRIHTWEENEDPTQLVLDAIRSCGHERGTIAIDEVTPFFTFDGLRRNAGSAFEFVNGSNVTAPCRRVKSPSELALLQAAKDITLEVQRLAASILEEGMKTADVVDFIKSAHPALGSDGPPTFVIVLFGEATAYPHGVSYEQELRRGDMVLIDTGATVEGYHSDITRSYVFGTPNDRQREVWNVEHEAQAAAFAAARPGVACASIDAAARRTIERHGFGPRYAVPGLPHRTGHGIGLDGHEWTYLVEGNATALEPGMCFSNEPMICIYGEFGVRLEDHFHVTEDGARWFTHPSPSIDDPFGLEAPSPAAADGQTR